MLEFAPRSKAEMSYDEALLYCQFLEYNGHRYWRMPTFVEWRDHYILGWYTSRVIGGYYPVTPVRDV